MEQLRNKFPDDPVNRIQKLYYDININTIFNRTKLRNIKKKFWKYQNYLNNKYFKHIQPLLLELGCIRDTAYCEWQRAKRKVLIRNPSLELAVREGIEPVFREADEEYEEMKREERFYDKAICDIQVKIYEIKKHQFNIYKHYRKCNNCKKMNMITISSCESKHKLCYDCIYNKTECPVCEEDLGLVHCDICYDYKKELVDTGCENKHKTCKECLDKIIRKTNLCPFCRDYCSKESSVSTFGEGTNRTVEEVDEMFNSYNRRSLIDEMLLVPDNNISDYYDRDSWLELADGMRER
jgi:hypothetical protein